MNRKDILHYVLEQIKGRKQSKTGKSKDPQQNLVEANVLFLLKTMKMELNLRKHNTTAKHKKERKDDMLSYNCLIPHVSSDEKASSRTPTSPLSRFNN